MDLNILPQETIKPLEDTPALNLVRFDSCARQKHVIFVNWNTKEKMQQIRHSLLISLKYEAPSYWSHPALQRFTPINFSWSPLLKLPVLVSCWPSHTRRSKFCGCAQTANRNTDAHIISLACFIIVLSATTHCQTTNCNIALTDVLQFVTVDQYSFIWHHILFRTVSRERLLSSRLMWLYCLCSKTCPAVSMDTWLTYRNKHQMLRFGVLYQFLISIKIFSTFTTFNI